MMRFILTGAAGLALLAATAATAAPHPGDDCLRSQNLRNHTIGDDHTLYFDYNGRATYQVTTSNNCAVAATSSDPVVFHNTATQGMMCKPIDWDISVRGVRCIVTGVRKLSPEEAAALPKGKRP